MFSIFIIIYTSVFIVNSSKILAVLPIPTVSHHRVFCPLIQELIQRGHEVTVIGTDPVYPKGGTPDNLKEIDLHDMSYKLRDKLFNKIVTINKSNLSNMQLIIPKFTDLLMEQLKDKSVLDLLRDTTVKFDLLILATYTPGILIFSHIFKAPVIFMSTFGALPGNMNMIGSNTHPILYPTLFHGKLYNLTILEKISELYYDIAYSDVYEKQEIDFDRRLKGMFGSDTPTLNELKSNVHMLFLNINPIWLHNQPVTQNVVYTWGIQKPSHEMLPKELQSYLDSSKHGVIYVSFGSIIKTSDIPPEVLKIFIKVLSRLSYNILWKWDSEELPGKSENIKISKWFPQCDVLRHPNVKLFITHGGLQSTNEAINAGVPVIGLPQFSDQYYNTEKYMYFKIGLKLDYALLTIENFENAIKTVFTNYNSFKENIVRLRKQMNDQAKPGLENTIDWIEYLLRNGGLQHLRAPAANMSWVEYYELEIVFLALTTFIVSTVVLLVTVYACLSFVLRLMNFKTNQSKACMRNKLK